MPTKSNLLVCLCLVLGLAIASPVHAGLAGWWKLDETTGTRAADSSGNGHNGTVTGAAQWTSGRIDGAMAFDGTTTSINCGLVNVDTAVTGGITVCAWVNITAANADYKLCSNQQVTSAAGGGFTCGIYNGRLSLDSCSATTRDLNRDSDGPPLPAGTWKHVAFVLDDVGNTFLEYQDGAAVDETTENVSIGVSTQPFIIGTNSPSPGHYYAGVIDDLRVYDTVLNEDQIGQVMLGGGPINNAAVGPRPAYGATDVPRNTALSWRPSQLAATHDVYLGTVQADVEAAGRANPLGVLGRQDLDANTFDPADLLRFGQTYYWRIDEVNAGPDPAIFKGNLWKFTVEPRLYAIEGVVATASIPNIGTATPQATVDRSGLDANDRHSDSSTAMWLGDGSAAGPVWIRYDFGKTYSLSEMWVWNSNSSFEPAVGFGVKDVSIEHSADDINWTRAGGVHQFARAPGLGGYEHNTTILFDGVEARYLRINIQNSWGGMNRYGLSEVGFYYEPVLAREPQPASGVGDVTPDVILSWRAGRDAVSHQIYLSTDRQAVVDGIALLDTTTTSTYAPSGVCLAATYYWKVNEVNNAEAVPIRQGDIWSFSTADHIVVDDFESYRNASPKRVFQTWIDGSGFSPDEFFPNGGEGNGTGALVGYDPLSRDVMEIAIVHSGSKSMPFQYDNTGSVTTSEAIRTFEAPQDWTRADIKLLVFYFYGNPANVPCNLYVKVNGTKIPCGGDAAMTEESWSQRNVDLAAVPVSSLRSVRTLTIGVEGTGDGTLLIDDLGLYKTAP